MLLNTMIIGTSGTGKTIEFYKFHKYILNNQNGPVLIINEPAHSPKPSGENIKLIDLNRLTHYKNGLMPDLDINTVLYITLSRFNDSLNREALNDVIKTIESCHEHTYLLIDAPAYISMFNEKFFRQPHLLTVCTLNTIHQLASEKICDMFSDIFILGCYDPDTLCYITDRANRTESTVKYGAEKMQQCLLQNIAHFTGNKLIWEDFKEDLKQSRFKSDIKPLGMYDAEK